MIKGISNDTGNEQELVQLGLMELCIFSPKSARRAKNNTVLGTQPCSVGSEELLEADQHCLGPMAVGAQVPA